MMKKLQLYGIVFSLLSCFGSINAQQLKTGEQFTYITAEGKEKTYEVIGENLIDNPSFDNWVDGWTDGGGGSLSGVDWYSNGGVDNGAYLRLTENAGKGSNGSIGMAWPIEKGKTYVFSYFIRMHTNPQAISKELYIRASETDTPRGDETKVILPAHEDANCAWTQNIVVTTAEYNYLQFSARWLGGSYCFDAFILAEVSEIANPKELEQLLYECEEWLNLYDVPQGKEAFAEVIESGYNMLSAFDNYTTSDVHKMLSNLNNALLDYQIANASYRHPVDVTNRYLKNPNFDNGMVDWTRNNDAVIGGTNIRPFEYFGENSRVLEIIGKPNIDTYIKQSITNLKDGYYRFYVEAVMNHNLEVSDSTAKSGAMIFCNGEEVDILTEKATLDGSTKENSYPESFSVIGYVDSGTLEVGFMGHADAKFKYVAIDNTKLEYLGYEAENMINPYIITYMVDGNIYEEVIVEAGSVIIPIDAPYKDGRSFMGWKNIPTRMPAKNIIIDGGFNYCTTFKIEEAIISSDSIVFGNKISIPDAPIKEGYTFNGWGEVPETMPAEDLVYEGSYTINSYNVTYSVDDNIYKKDTITYNAPLTPEEFPVKEGHTFSGWSEIPDSMPAHDINVYGSFIVNKYEVAYVIGQDTLSMDSVAYGSTVPLPDAPVKEGYTFNGWEGVKTMPAEDIVLTGSYTINNYKLEYVVDGELYHSTTVAYNDTIVPISTTPSKEGYTFVGWVNLPTVMPANDVRATAMFEANRYRITYIVDNQVVAIDSVAYGTNVVLMDPPAVEGYTFAGWSYVPEKMPAADVMVIGIYTINSYQLTYMVDSVVYDTKTIVYDEDVPVLEEPTKEGYTFSGWSEIPETMPASDVIISGTFTVNKYLVTFKIGDEVIAADSLAYGASIVAPEAPEKEGYTFNGWGEVAEVVPANDVTIEGSYSVNFYLLTYTVDGETVQTDSVAYSTAITLLDEPIKEGHTFSGWSEAPEAMPASDVTISGTFTVNKYLVTFKIGDEVIAADSLEYGATIVAPEVPEKEGYTFDGWGEVAETVPANDVTYEGTYTVNIYKVYYYVGEELVHTAEVAYGEAIPEYVYEPTEAGYTFLGWIGDTYETMPAHDVTYTANIDDAIEQLTIDNSQLTIYDLSGRKVLDTENLKGGIYIVNGRKVIVK